MTYPTGKGIFIWMLSASANGDPLALATQAQLAGLSWVAIKVQNGARLFQETLVPQAVSALRGAGIDVWGWGYLGGSPSFRTWGTAAQEAQTTLQAVDRFSLDGFIIDAESEYKRAGANTWARVYMTSLKVAMPHLSLGLCSYRWPSLHPQLPWSTFLAGCAFHIPQVYWQESHNPAEQLRRSVRELTALKSLPVVPVGSSYSEHGWAPTVAELDAFDREAHGLKLPGVGWWSWQALDNHPDWWGAISAHDWDLEETPPVPLTVEQKVDLLWEHHNQGAHA